MNKLSIVLLLGVCVWLCSTREPIKARPGSLPFLVYYRSRYRGLCAGFLVARSVVLTAAVCITSHLSMEHDLRPITVVVGTPYRHPRRGIRVQVTKILLPNLKSTIPGNQAYLMQMSVAVLLLKRQVPDVLMESPLQTLDVDWSGEEKITLNEECLIAGWHFFGANDIIYPVYNFKLQRNLRAQFMNVAKTSSWCEALLIKKQQVLTSMGYRAYLNPETYICIKDPERTAQPCHGMYGAPLVCRGRAVAMLMAPDAQWTNCTGFSNIVHVFNSPFLKNFMSCVSSLFNPPIVNWAKMKRDLTNESQSDYYDYVSPIYDKMSWNSGTESDEE
ncbi:hypothetical protein ACJJTC_000878 [Scirpophaga incertulas]